MHYLWAWFSLCCAYENIWYDINVKLNENQTFIEFRYFYILIQCALNMLYIYTYVHTYQNIFEFSKTKVYRNTLKNYLKIENLFVLLFVNLNKSAYQSIFLKGLSIYLSIHRYNLCFSRFVCDHDQRFVSIH